MPDISNLNMVVSFQGGNTDEQMSVQDQTCFHINIKFLYGVCVCVCVSVG